jgi:Restriction endonuclease
MSIATKTLNPLHFEDLDPHRFEDLARQLMYDYKDWQKLEPTGRGGSDDGFDARGWEVYDNDGIEEDRIWLIQCKREKTISPAKLLNYLNELNNGNISQLYGIIFIAACDFSKKTRDTYREWCNTHKVSEFHIIGKADLEDMLFQPKYDYLLFAYFGISIQIKKRTMKSQLRSKLATKNQVMEQLEGYSNNCKSYSYLDISTVGCPMMCRESEVHEYPDSDKVPNFNESPLWVIAGYQGTYHSGLKFLISSHFAYIDEDRKWDYEEKNPHYLFDNPWIKNKNDDLKEKADKFHFSLPFENRKILHRVGLILYDDVLAIDKYGDEYFENPHIYVKFNKFNSPFTGGEYKEIDGIRLNEDDRIIFFPKAYE